MCFENYIGIRGECSDASIYIDDLPGINIQNAADVVEGTQVRPIELITTCFTLALDQVYNDWINNIKSHFDYLGIVSDTEYKNAGIFEYYGENSESIQIKIQRLGGYQKLVQSSIYSFGIVSDRAITKTFYVFDEYGAELIAKEVDLVVGYNDIDINVISSSIELNIRFSLSDFKVGRKENVFNYLSGCSPCFEVGCTDCTFVSIQKSTNNFVNSTSLSSLGFNLKVKCVADKCEILKYFIENLKVPLLYKTGINYLIAAKMSSRVNSYTVNSMDKIDELLILWQGGTDTVTGIKTNSAYWSALKAASESSVSTLRNMRLPIFKYNSDTIVNSLP